MGQKVEVSGTGYVLKGGKPLIGGTAYAIKKGRTLIGGTGYDISLLSATPISELPVGSIVKIAVDGTLRKFLVVQQGSPSWSYTNANGAWLLMKDAYEIIRWAGTTDTTSGMYGNYKYSEVNKFLNNTFYGRIESSVRNLIKEVSIPYVAQSIGGSVTGRCFALSCTELGWSNVDYMPSEGNVLNYFNGLAAMDARRIAYAEGEAAEWWTRSAYTYWDYAVPVFYCATNGLYGAANALTSNRYRVRPAFILPSDTLVSDDGTITT